MKTVIKVLIGIAVLVMAYLCFMSIYTPVRFGKEQKARENKIKERLKEIASYELAYKTVNGRFASAQELVSFLDTGQLYYVNAEGDYTDHMREDGLSEQEAAAKGLIKRDTVYVSAKDSLLKDSQVSSATELLEVPGFPKNQIDVATKLIEQVIGVDTIHVSVFEASVPMSLYLADLDKQLYQEAENMARNRNNGKGFPGLKIGSLEELKLTGNWE